ncbi:MAG: phosphodiester glycosidase family protein [Rikenellaceae bacterium]
MKKIINNICVLTAMLLVVASCSPTTLIAETPDSVVTTSVGEMLLDCDQIAHIYSDSTFLVATGVECTDLHFKVMDGFVVHAHLIKADLNVAGVAIGVSMPDNVDVYGGPWSKQTLSNMADCHDRSGARVVAMTNGDFWDTSYTIPRGPIHRNGNTLSGVYNYSEAVPQQAISFVALNSDGQMVIADASLYSEMASELKEVTGSGVIMLQYGEVPAIEYTARDPRTAIGYTDDGVVYMLTADGRATLYSDGMSYQEMGSLFKALGCEAAVNLDGGGSAQMLIRNPVSQSFQIRNVPSDGSERAVINGWYVTVDEK